jgi:hypothetical protein
MPVKISKQPPPISRITTDELAGDGRNSKSRGTTTLVPGNAYRGFVTQFA